jgi:hypothetical protein
LDLVDPVVSQEIALYWAEGETVMPMANALVAIVKSLNKSGELRRRLGDPTAVPAKNASRDVRSTAGAIGKTGSRPSRIL